MMNWNSFKPTETHRKVPVPVAWQHTTWLQIKQLRIDVSVGTIHPTCQLLVRDVHNAAESVLRSSACAVIYGVMSHVHISNTPSSTNIIVELDGLLQASKQLMIWQVCLYVTRIQCDGHYSLITNKLLFYCTTVHHTKTMLFKDIGFTCAFSQ